MLCVIPLRIVYINSCEGQNNSNVTIKFWVINEDVAPYQVRLYNIKKKSHGAQPIQFRVRKVKITNSQ